MTDDTTQSLGLDVPRGEWPTPAMLKGIEAAGFGWVQLHAPPCDVLQDRGAVRRHAAGLRAALRTCGLHAILHAPPNLAAGIPHHDRALDGLLDYASALDARYVAYHGANFPLVGDEDGRARLADRLHREEASLHARADRLQRLGTTLAIENLAPVFPGPPRVVHYPAALADLAAGLGSPAFGVLFDVGHAHIACELEDTLVAAALSEVADEVVLFHVHDNLGARRGHHGSPQLDPLRLDLHLAPGAGRVPWRALAPAIAARGAPIVLEVRPPHAGDPVSLHATATELVLGRRSPVTATRAYVPLG